MGLFAYMGKTRQFINCILFSLFLDQWLNKCILNIFFAQCVL